jgi:hypothetical protein
MVQVALPKRHSVVLSNAVWHLVQVDISQNDHWVLSSTVRYGAGGTAQATRCEAERHSVIW